MEMNKQQGHTDVPAGITATAQDFMAFFVADVLSP
jgi:hypothetical protein